MKKNIGRRYISLYFKDKLSSPTKNRYLTIAFNEKDCLYIKCKKLGASKIKKIIGVASYRDLSIEANKENRTFGNYIKHKLKLKLGQY